MVHTTGDPLALASSVQKEIQAIDPDQPVYRVRTMTQVMAESVARRRLGATLLGVFAALAMLLSVLGIYGVIAFDVAQRTNEIGIRIALGAQRISVIQLMLSDGLRPVLVGILVGLVGGAICGRLIRTMLFDARPLDPSRAGGRSAGDGRGRLRRVPIPSLARRKALANDSTALRVAVS